MDNSNSEEHLAQEEVRYSPYFIPHSLNGQIKTDSSAKTKGKIKSTNSPRRPKGSPKKSPQKTESPQKDLTKPISKFGGKTEEELLQMVLPDHLDYDLDILITGYNPGLAAAYKGHHYAGSGNHFWPLLYQSGFIPEKMTCLDDNRCLQHGIGFTNIVTRTTRGSADLSRKEIKEGAEELKLKVQKYKPLIICFNGKGMYEIFSGKKCELGPQPEPFPGAEKTTIFVMPSTSGRLQNFPRASDKLPFFLQMKELRDRLRVERGPRKIQAQSLAHGLSEDIPSTLSVGVPNRDIPSEDVPCDSSSPQELSSAQTANSIQQEGNNSNS